MKDVMADTCTRIQLNQVDNSAGGRLSGVTDMRALAQREANKQRYQYDYVGGQT